jgi:hypothetical protein
MHVHNAPCRLALRGSVGSIAASLTSLSRHLSVNSHLPIGALIMDQNVTRWFYDYVEQDKVKDKATDADSNPPTGDAKKGAGLFKV